MLKKIGFIVGVVLVVGGLAALYHNGAPNNVQPEIPVAAVEKKEAPDPVVKEELKEVEIPAIAKVKPAEEKKPAPAKKRKGMDYAKLRPSIREVLTGDDYNDRLRAVKYDLPENLDGREYRGLKSYLLQPQDGKDGDFRQHEYALRNYMMDAMRAEQDQLGETIGSFAGIYRNEAQGEVMRNYALQHLASVYIDNTSSLSVGDKSRIVKTLKAAMNDTSAESLAGTALIGLQDASRWDAKTVSPTSVGNASMKLLRDENSSDLSKISAFQVGGELKLKSVGSYARETAFDSNADWVLRMSAVYALGQLGETSGLNALLNDSNKNVRKAAFAALNGKR